MRSNPSLKRYLAFVGCFPRLNCINALGESDGESAFYINTKQSARSSLSMSLGHCCIALVGSSGPKTDAGANGRGTVPGSQPFRDQPDWAYSRRALWSDLRRKRPHNYFVHIHVVRMTLWPRPRNSSPKSRPTGLPRCALCKPNLPPTATCRYRARPDTRLN